MSVRKLFVTRLNETQYNKWQYKNITKEVLLYLYDRSVIIKT